MTTDPTASVGEDARAGLTPRGVPLHPLSQLEMGAIEVVGIVTWSAGGNDSVAPANPMRLALYVVPRTGTGAIALGPAGQPVVVSFGALGGPVPVVVHCRDFPGLTQQEWVGTGPVGATATVYEYTIKQ